LSNSDSNINDGQIIEYAKQQYLIALEQLERYKAILSLYRVELPDLKTDNVINSEIDSWRLVNKADSTFGEVIESILSDGTPRVTQELRAKYIERTGNVYELRTFSNKMNILKVRGNRVNNVEYNELPLGRRHWWGLPEWFNTNGDLKKEYKSKIPDLARN
jgi:hypothetical protein